MQPPCLQLGCNCWSHATMQGFLCNRNGFLPPFQVCMQLWCNYDHLHPNLWMIFVDIYYRIYTFGHILSYIFDMHVLIVACATKIGQLWSFGKLCTHFLQACLGLGLPMTIPLIRFRIQVKNNLIHFATPKIMYLSPTFSSLLHKRLEDN